MNGTVRLTVTQLELIQPGAQAKAVRVRAVDETTGDVASIAVLLEDAPLIGSVITLRIEPAEPQPPDQDPTGVVSAGGDPG